jgi:Dehydrogenase E1 component
MHFEQPSTYPPLSTYRVVDQHGAVVDPSFKPDLDDEAVIKLYRDMLVVSIMDLIMFDAQRQGRLSFYMVSAGEEAVSVGTASALEKEDVVFCQYREQGVFKQRGFKLSDFMNQLFANNKDPGKGRNMPVHYGSRELNIVSWLAGFCKAKQWRWIVADKFSQAHDLVAPCDTAPTSFWGRVCAQDPEDARPNYSPTGGSGLLWGRGCKRG